MNNFEIVSHSDIEYINLFLVKVMYRTVHSHRDLEMLYVVDGSMTVVTLEKEYVVTKNQFFFLNSNQSHEIKTVGKGVTLICLQISPNYFKRYFPNGEMFYFFGCSSINNTDPTRLDNMRHIFLKLTKTYIEQKKYYKIQFDSLLNFFLHEILQGTEHQMLSQEEIDAKNNQLSRLNKLLAFVDKNYTHKIRLQDFAKQEGLSIYYLSHFVKNSLHQTFQEYVTSLRLHHACTLLVNSNKNIIDICLESGFSDTRYLYKAFSTAYNITPNQYRDEYRLHPDATIMTQISEHSLQQYFPRDKMIRLVSGMLSD